MRKRMFALLWTAAAVLVVNATPAAAPSGTLKWIQYVCSRPDPYVRARLIRQTQMNERQTFECPPKGTPVTLESAHWRWFWASNALIRERIPDVTMDKINAVCAMPPGEQRDEYLRQLKKAGVDASCADKQARAALSPADKETTQ